MRSPIRRILTMRFSLMGGRSRLAMLLCRLKMPLQRPTAFRGCPISGVEGTPGLMIAATIAPGQYPTSFAAPGSWKTRCLQGASSFTGSVVTGSGSQSTSAMGTCFWSSRAYALIPTGATVRMVRVGDRSRVLRGDMWCVIRPDFSPGSGVAIIPQVLREGLR